MDPENTENPEKSGKSVKSVKSGHARGVDEMKTRRVPFQKISEHNTSSGFGRLNGGTRFERKSTYFIEFTDLGGFKTWFFCIHIILPRSARRTVEQFYLHETPRCQNCPPRFVLTRFLKVDCKIRSTSTRKIRKI